VTQITLDVWEHGGLPGGALTHGINNIKCYASTQSVIATSSGESEFYGMVKMGSMLVGGKSMAEDLGLELKLVMKADATAGIGMAKRRGVGKVRHLHTQTLWLQGKVLEKVIDVRKEAGATNCSDLMTKHVTCDEMMRHLARLGFQARSGRSNLYLKA
jgi:hypothetical protein